MGYDSPAGVAREIMTRFLILDKARTSRLRAILLFTSLNNKMQRARSARNARKTEHRLKTTHNTSLKNT